MNKIIRSILFVLLLCAFSSQLSAASEKAAGSRDPWTKTQLLTPELLHERLTKSGEKPVLIQIGFRPLYDQGHIPGSVYLGPGAKAEGISALTEFARKLPRSRDLILYCGCCPWDECPNIRPAFKALKAMGFTRLKVVEIPNNFGKDWAAKGFPVERGK